MLDVVALLGAGWTIDDQQVVTSDNQMSMSTMLPDSCELKTKATAVPSAWGGEPTYAPPIGWTVYYVSRPAGYGAEALKLNDDLWVSPDGMAYSVSSCAKNVAMVSDATSLVVTPVKSNTNVWLVLGILGIAAYFTFKS